MEKDIDELRHACSSIHSNEAYILSAETEITKTLENQLIAGPSATVQPAALAWKAWR